MRLTPRAMRLAESATTRVARRAAELRAQGHDIVDFGPGEPDFPSPPPAVAAAAAALAAGFTRYTAVDGLPELRHALAAGFRERHGAPWDSDQVVVTVGAKQALFQLALALFDDDHEVVLNTPCWVSFPEQVRFAGGTVVEVPLQGEDGFRIHAEPLIASLGDRTRAVILNSPGNPTGGIVTADDLRRLVAACAARGVLVVADETYERFVYHPGGHASAARLAAEFPDTVVVVGSFSKTYAMTGWRLGYLLGPRPVARAVARIQSHSSSNPTSFAMMGALAALAAGEPHVERMLAEYHERRALVVERLAALPGVRCVPPDGGFLIFPDVSALYDEGMRGSVAFAERLLEEEGVAVVAGEAFGSDRHIRISYACSRERLESGLARLGEFVSARVG